MVRTEVLGSDHVGAFRPCEDLDVSLRDRKQLEGYGQRDVMI